MSRQEHPGNISPEKMRAGLAHLCGRRMIRAAVLGLVLSGNVPAEVNFYETEPNNTPAEANPISGEVTVYGTMVSGDQDGYLWTVSDDGARKRWSFELQGIPGALTIAELVKLEYSEDGERVAGVRRMMKVATRDGLSPAMATDLLFEPGEYLVGIAYAGGPKQEGGGLFRPPPASLDFGENGTPRVDEGDVAVPESADPGAYRFVISEAGRLSVRPNPGPRISKEGAQAIKPGGAFATFEPLEETWYRFAFNEEQAEQRWDIDIRAPVGRVLRARLEDADGQTLSEGIVDSHGRIRFADLAPPKGEWFVVLRASNPGLIHWVRSTAVGQRVAGEEAEPNDARDLANRVDFVQAVTGRIGGDDRYDHFLFSLEDAARDQLQTLRIESEPAVKLRLCLKTADWDNVQCRSGTTPLELPDLLIPPGEWGILIERASETAYRLSLTPQGPLEPGMEVEPNDGLAYASGVPANMRVKGRFTGDDTDYYRFLIAEEPQLWRFQVIGDGVQEVGYADGSGKERFKRRAQGGQRRIRLDDVFLLPGRHSIRVAGRDGGQYTLLARPLGPPDPNGEIEPNDESNMQRLVVGQTRTGLLTDAGDSDYYRFFLANWDHVRLTIAPPVDGVIDGYLYWYGSPLGNAQPGGPGEALSIEGLFPPGDYHFWLQAKQTSDAEYTVTLERLPRFSCPADCEPNGMRELWLAAPLPPDLLLQGRTGEWRDWDYYQLPALDRPAPVLIHAESPVRVLALGSHYNERETLDYDADSGAYHAEIPAGPAHRLMIDSRGKPYRLQLEFPDGPLTAVNEALAAELQVVLDSPAVSAFRGVGQRVTGRLEIVNHRDSELRLRVDAVTSDYRWAVSLQQRETRIPANGKAAVPLEVSVPADAWAEWPVRISGVARDAAGRQAEGWAEIAVQRDIEPIAPRLAWSIPQPLRGGFNVAWLPFGAEWTEDSPKAVKRTDILRDGLVFPGARVESPGDGDGWSEEDKPRWTLKLPGDEPMPVAGVAINHFGTPGPFVDIREATLLLSLDGDQFDEVLHLQALSVESEQYFALQQPVPARYARLRIDSTFAEASSQRVFAAEWKVILEPGFDLSNGAGFNLADPALGGHIVWDRPPKPYSPTGVLVLGDEENSGRAHTGNERTKDYVIGFNNNRAARITSVEWQYADSTKEESRAFSHVEVSVSVTTPVGPWSPLGAIDMGNAKLAGRLSLEQASWARYVRLTAHLLPHRRASAPPGVIRIQEQATNEGYRSVLTEWGHGSSLAFYEQQAGLSPDPALKVDGNESRATAAALELATPARGQVALGQKEHWFRLAVPVSDNTLTITLNGDPTVRTVLAMEDAGGEALLLRRIDRKNEPGRHQFEAVVDPGSEVYLRVTEPPRNVIFSWDTSASVNAYIPLINNALVAFSGQVVPGQEAVNLMPFPQGPLLRDWYGEPYILQTILNDYRRTAASSSAEYTMKIAAQELAPLPGTKAIVLITDAQSPHDGAMWRPMRDVQPRIFAVGVAGSAMGDQHRFRDWAGINGGHYTQLLYEGEMEVAFDRATTLMHRPAGYALRVDSEYREAPGPGWLQVAAGEVGTVGAAALELILDASGSMLQRIEGKRRIAVAKEVLAEAVLRNIPAGTPVALRVFGHREVDSCRTDLEIPLAPLDPKAAAAKIEGIEAMNLARTPIADSLKAAQSDLGGATGAAIVLVTDGEETCDGDPAAVITAMQEAGLDVTLNIVGFAIGDKALARQFEAWAELGGGRYFAADDPAGLHEAIEVALRVPFTVYDRGGNGVATGLVGGDAVELEQGVYKVVVNSSPERTFEDVEVRGETAVALTLD